MTIPEYDVECDCDFCIEERNKRLKASDRHAIRSELLEKRRECRL